MSVSQKILCLFICLGSMAHASFLPKADLDKAQVQAFDNGMTESEFNKIISQIQNAYSPVVTQLGGKLSIRGDWKSTKLNAAASQMFGSWNVQITGALARRAELSADAFTLILCHELGHHLGGFALAGSPIPDVPLPIPIPVPATWAANEGQSDYFSTQVCARKLWAADLELNRQFKDKVHPLAQKQCDSQWSSDAERDLCYRVSVGAESIGATMAGIKQEAVPKIETPDPSVVNKTNDGHPAIQCRLDTLVAGAYCPVVFNQSIIPGKKTPEGHASLEAEKEAAQFSCTAFSGYSVGLRPACWFKARI